MTRLCKKTAGKERAVLVSTEKTCSQNENNTQKGRCTINYDTQRGVLSITMEKRLGSTGVLFTMTLTSSEERN